MIEPKEYKVINSLIGLVEYKINSVSNYLKNYEYEKARRELHKANNTLHIIKYFISS